MKLNKTSEGLLLAILLLSSCGTPQNIKYVQDLGDQYIEPFKVDAITLQPMDQVSIVVNSRDPQIASMFNLPYYGYRIGDTQSLTSSSNVATYQNHSQNIAVYTVDSNGDIDFPVLGKIHAVGMKRDQLAETIKEKLVVSGQVKDPVVIVDYMNLGVSVIGEVARPGRYKIDREKFTIFDAIGLAGDLTINGERQTVTVIRHVGDIDKIYKIDLTNGHDVYNSPAYYVAQNDVVIVSPNDKRKRESTLNGNNIRSTSFWLSVVSVLTALGVLLFK